MNTNTKKKPNQYEYVETLQIPIGINAFIQTAIFIGYDGETGQLLPYYKIQFAEGDNTEEYETAWIQCRETDTDEEKFRGRLVQKYMQMKKIPKIG